MRSLIMENVVVIFNVEEFMYNILLYVIIIVNIEEVI